MLEADAIIEGNLGTGRVVDLNLPHYEYMKIWVDYRVENNALDKIEKMLAKDNQVWCEQAFSDYSFWGVCCELMVEAPNGVVESKRVLRAILRYLVIKHRLKVVRVAGLNIPTEIYEAPPLGVPDPKVIVHKLGMSGVATTLCLRGQAAPDRLAW